VLSPCPPGRQVSWPPPWTTESTILAATFPAVFEHPAFQQEKSATTIVANQRYDPAIDLVERQGAGKEHCGVPRPQNIAFTPMKDGKALDEAEVRPVARGGA